MEIQPRVTEGLRKSVKSWDKPVSNSKPKSIAVLIAQLNNAEEKIGVPIDEDLRELYIAGETSEIELKMICSMAKLRNRSAK